MFVSSLYVRGSGTFFGTGLGLLCYQVKYRSSFSLTVVTEAQLSTNVVAITASIHVVYFGLHAAHGARIHRHVFRSFPQVRWGLSLGS